jgi:hypothetical protein
MITYTVKLGLNELLGTGQPFVLTGVRYNQEISKTKGKAEKCVFIHFNVLFLETTNGMGKKNSYL